MVNAHYPGTDAPWSILITLNPVQMVNTPYPRQLTDKAYKVIRNKSNKISNSNSIINIRFSSIYKLNDSSEIDLGLNRIKKLTRNIRESKSDDKFWKKYLDDILSNKKLVKILKDNSYVFSLSMLKNDLNQWRLYGDDGKGISLELDKDILCQVYNNYIFSVLNEINYEETKIVDSVEKLIYHGIDAENSINSLTDGNMTSEYNLKEISKTAFFFQILSTMGFIKHKAFMPEKEVRIIYSPINIDFIINNKSKNEKFDEFLIKYKDRIKSYDIANNVIYYYKILCFPKCCLKKLWLGPKNPSTPELFYDYLEHNGFDNVEVEKSKLPYK